MIGELTLRCGTDVGVPTFALSGEGDRDCYHLIYSGTHDVCLHGTPLTLSVNLIRSCGIPAPVRSYLVDTLPSSGIISSRQYFVSHSRQELPFIGCGTLRPGDILGVSSFPLVEIPFDSAWSPAECHSDDPNVVDPDPEGLIGAIDESADTVISASPSVLLERFTAVNVRLS